MKRELAILGGAAVALVAGSLVLIDRFTESSTSPGSAGPAPWETTSPGAGPGSAEAGTPVRMTQPAPVSLPEHVPDPVPRPSPAWLEGATRSLAPTRDGSVLGPLRPYVAAGLGRLQQSVAACADEMEAAGGGTGALRRGRVVLTLQFETLDSRLRIVDVTLVNHEDEADPRVACAMRKLRGQLMPAPSKRGSSFEVPFVLNL